MADEYVHTHGRKVSEIMTSESVTVTEDTPLEEVVSLMEKRRIKRLPVIKGDRVVGIISRANLLYALAGLAYAAWMHSGGRPDRSAKIGLMRPSAASCPAV